MVARIAQIIPIRLDAVIPNPCNVFQAVPVVIFAIKESRPLERGVGVAERDD